MEELTTKLSTERIMAELKKVEDPELRRDIVSLGMVKDIKIEGSKVSLALELTTPACPLKAEFENAVRKALDSIPGVSNVDIKLTANVRKLQNPLQQQSPIDGVKNIIAVASGKGGVGKSTVAVNIAAGLAFDNAKTGLLDADIYGPSLPIMMGINEKPLATPDKRIIPLEKHGLKLMSIGFLLENDAPVIWRGPMVTQLLQQFLRNVEWGELDYLIIDLPPGTGDTQLTLVQTIPLSGAIIVTTPQDIALIDASRGLQMFNKVNVPVLGIVENMSYFICSNCGHRTEIFSHGGGQKTSERLGVPFLGEIPIDPVIRASGDSGKPVIIENPVSQQSKAFMEIARRIAAGLSVISISPH
ncbi:MAG TPA: iron-sulfur cluster carrier protein ApbC [bacterium]